MARHTISNRDDILDSRDILARIEALEGERETLAEAVEEAESAFNDLEVGDTPEYAEAYSTLQDAVNEARADLSSWDDSSDAEELKTLRAFAEEGESNVSDWVHGATLIRDDYFEAYAEQLADDIGALGRNAKWPANHIDWEAAAQELQQDYTSIEWDGVTYWGQS